MALDLEEQEQLAELKAWWKQNRYFVIVGISAFVIGVVGWKFWQYWSYEQKTQASAMFESAMQASAGGDQKALKEVTGQIMEGHGRSGYATAAAWLAGKANFVAGDLKSAEAQYQYALEHAKDDGAETLGRLRLAALHLDQKQFDEALKLLDGKYDPAFAGLVANLRGDVLVAQGKAEDARAAYRLALQAIDPKSPLKPLVEVKLDGLGG